MTGALTLAAMVEVLAPHAATFAALSAQCAGAWPGEVARILGELRRSGRVAHADADRLAASAATPPSLPAPLHDRRLPLAHPLDFDWRFAVGSADALLAAVDRLMPHARNLLLVCAPTVAVRAAEWGDRWGVTLAGRPFDPVAAASTRAAEGAIRFVDLAGDMAAVRADAAIVDPPWYDDIAMPLLGKALAGLSVGGLLLACRPDRLTGASAADLLAGIEAQADTLGLSGAVQLPTALRYETPLFELNALRALGLAGTHPRWRTGRVVAATKARLGCALGDVAPGEWLEASSGPGHKWDHDTGPCGKPAASLGGCVVPSVSRGHPARVEAALWTSGNRASKPCTSSPPGSQEPWPDLGSLLETEKVEASRLLRWRCCSTAVRPGRGTHAVAGPVGAPRIFVRAASGTIL